MSAMVSAYMRPKPIPARHNDVASETENQLSDQETTAGDYSGILAPKTRKHWPAEGRSNHLQSNETVPEYIMRLPPSSTSISECSWIWADNPYHAHAKDEHMDLETLKRDGNALLDKFLQKKTTMQGQGKAKGTITKALKGDIVQLAVDLRQTAINAGCLCGKWMLFVPVSEVDRVWNIVAQSVSSGKLGHVAKVAPRDEDKKEDIVRLICIYTSDFTNEKDVKRVLNGLVSLGLVSADLNSRPIYYKCDAYTYWGLTGNHEYGVSKTLYNSKDVLHPNAAGKKKS